MSMYLCGGARRDGYNLTSYATSQSVVSQSSACTYIVQQPLSVEPAGVLVEALVNEDL